MSLRLCLTCAAIDESANAAKCAACGGALVSPSRANLRALLDARVRVAIDAWESDGVLDAETSNRLRGGRASARDSKGARRLAGPEAEHASHVPRAEEGLLALLARRQREASERWNALVSQVEASPPPAAPEGVPALGKGSGGDTRDAVDAARALFGGGGKETGAGGGLEALVDLDDATPSSRGNEASAGSLMAEYAWWFLGTLLVLAGSVMGVREAWRALAGPPRQIVIAAALFGYHGMFLGLSALVARRSALAGRVLASIAVGLLPTVFVALAALVEGSRVPGLALSGVALALAAVTLTSAGKRFSGSTSKTLALVVVPSLAAEVLVGSAPTVGLRVGVPFVGVLAAAFAGVVLGRARTMVSGVASFAAAIYAAIALGLFAVLGAPGSDAPPIETGSVAHAAVLLYFLTLSLVIGHTVGRESVRRLAPHVGPAIELTAFAGVALVSCVAARAALLGVGASGVAWLDASARTGVREPAAFAFAALPALGAAGFGLAVRRHPAAVHPTVLLGTLAAFLLALAAYPGNASMAFAGAAAASALVLVASRFAVDALRIERSRPMLEVWGGGLGLLAIGFAGALATEPRGEPVLECVLGAGLVAVASHVAGGIARARMHALGALAALAAAAAFFVPSTLDDGPTRFVHVCAGLATAYGVMALVHGHWLAKRAHDHGERPLDDLSLAFALLGGVVSAAVLPVAVDLALAPQGLGVREVVRLVGPVALPGLLIAAVLALRAVRDRSRVVAFAATLVAGSSLCAALGATQGAGLALAMGIAAAASTALAAARGRGPEPSPAGASSTTPSSPSGVSVGRLFAGVLPLPFGATGSALLDGVAAGAFVFGARAVLATVDWLGPRPEAERVVAVIGVSLVAGAVALAFTSNSHRVFALRGSVVSLALLAGLGAFAGITNRIGRPLPPAVVGLRLSIFIGFVWLVARLLVRFGPRMAVALGRPSHGASYHFVAHAGVLALGALLGVDAVLVGGPTLARALVVTPPTLLLGAALAAFLLVRSFGRSAAVVPLLHVGAGAALLASPFLAVQGRLLGPDLVPLVPPGAQWVLPGTEDAARVSWLDPVRFLPEGETMAHVLVRAWTGLLVFSIAATAGMALLKLSPLGRRVLVKGALDLDPEEHGRRVATAFFVATLLAVGIAVVGAFAQPALDVVPVSGLLVIGAFALGGASLRTGQDAAKLLAGAAVVLSGVAAFVGTACALAHLGPTSTPPIGSRVTLSSLDAAAAVSAFGPALALALALVAAASHLVAWAQEAPRPLQAWGLGAGRDVLLVATLVLLAWLGTSAPSLAPLRVPIPLAGLALVLVAGVAVHALARSRTPRHAYVLQVSIVAAYALVRLAVPSLPPFVDAVAALFYGFVLVGATTLARRLDVPPVAAATRRFAAALPLLVALLRADGASIDSTLIAAGSGVLYAALSAADKSRLFGALAAVAGNLALVLGALTLGFDGIEAYFGPLGLLLLTLSQIFASKLSPQSRTLVRIFGSLLLYVPAGMKLTLRLGQASDGTYSVLFGVVCFLGIFAGMALRIRAYVVLGTLFVTLDVVANLLFAGLRDHRVGFVILSVSGLGILATMIGMTLKRDEVRSVVRRVRGALRGWD